MSRGLWRGWQVENNTLSKPAHISHSGVHAAKWKYFELYSREAVLSHVKICSKFQALICTAFSYCNTVEPLTNDHPHQRPSLSYDHISCDGQGILCVYESLTSDHHSYTTTPMWFWGWSYKRGSTVIHILNSKGVSVLVDMVSKVQSFFTRPLLAKYSADQTI